MGRADDAKRKTRKRAYGAGSAWQDKDGQWWAIVFQNGRRHRYRAASEQAARARLTALNDQKRARVDIAAGRSTVAQHLQAWMDQVVINLKPKTQRAYRQTTEHFLIPFLGHVRLSELTPEQILGMLNALRQAGYADQTIKHAYTVGRTALEYAVKWRKLATNPFAVVDTPTVRTTEPAPLSDDEAAALLHAVEDHRLHVLYQLALTLGLRKGELLGLRIGDVDLKKATLTVAQQVLDLPGGPRIEDYTKNDKVRTLPLTARLVALLRVRLTQVLAERDDAMWKENGLLFPSLVGTPMSERNLDRQFKASLKRARMRDVGFHLLRHTCLTWLGESGANESVIGAVAGHSGATVTARYVHIGLAALRAAVERMEGEKLIRRAA